MNSYKAKYKNLVNRIIEILDIEDPLRLCAPPGEYSPEATEIAWKVKSDISIEEAQNLIYEIFVEYFDADTAGPKQNYEVIAIKVLEFMKENQ